MASEHTTTEDKQFTCSICMENYTIPRYLPTCGHTFCEHCLLNYASNLQQQGSTFECPVCRKLNCLPENSVTLDWIQTFPLNTAMIELMGATQPMKTESETLRECDPCKERGEIKTGVKFCMDCQEIYCEVCTDYHKGFKMTKRHRLMDTKVMSGEANRADFFTSFTKCANHSDREVEFYCQSHDVVVCATCASIGDHSKPCDVVEISSHGTDDSDVTKLQEESEKMASQMREIINHINLLNELKNGNKRKLKTKLKYIKEQIHQVRDQVVKLMDNVESHVSDVAKQIEIENEDKMDTEMSKVLKLKGQIEGNLALLDTVGQNGSERHKFISAHLMKSQIEEIGRLVSEQDWRTRNVDAELKVADDIIKLIESADVENLVQVTVNESKSSHKHLDTVSNALRDIKLVKKEEHTVRPNAQYFPTNTGIAVFMDDRVIISDNFSNSANLCLYDPTDKNIIQLKLNCPYSAAQIDGTHIAVSLPNDKAISIVTVGNDLRLEKTLKTQNTPRSIVTVGNHLRLDKTLKTQYTPRSIVALNNGQLAVSWTKPPAFSIIDISGPEIVQKSYLDQDSNGRNLRSFDYLAVDEKRHHVIQPCNQDKAVFCFDFTGKPVFKYTDPGLKNPQGVALDMCGNMYVCACNSPGSIHKVSPAGEPIIIITEGVPPGLMAICSDTAGTGFWVTTSSPWDKLTYFKLEQKTPA